MAYRRYGSNIAIIIADGTRGRWSSYWALRVTVVIEALNIGPLAVVTLLSGLMFDVTVTVTGRGIYV